MSWITQNKFLAGFAAAMVVSVGALGYLTYSAMDRSTAADEDYEGALGELKRLQGGHPYPDKANREKIAGQKTALQEKITDFQKQLANTVLPVAPLSPTDFQDKLKETVARVTAKASGDAHLGLPNKQGEKFYMGFPEYASRSPKEAQVPLLSRELAAFESIINLMLAAKDVELKELKRPESKEEHPKPPGAKPAAAARPERKLLQHTTFTLKFESSDIAFRNILNGIVGSKEHFFIVRRISVNNTKLQAPPKNDTALPKPPLAPAAPAGTPPGTPPAPPAPPAPEPAQRLEYVFGTERVEVTLEIELVDFTKPEAPPVKAEKKEKEAK